MKHSLFYKLQLLFVCLLTGNLAMAQADPLLSILKNEMNREWEVLSKTETPAYYLSYRIHDLHVESVSANLGSLIDNSESQLRLAKVDVRVGDYSVDNTRELSNNFINQYHGGYGMQYIPFENEATAIHQSLWRITEDQYKSSEKAYKQIMSQIDQEEKEEKAPDFSKEDPVSYIDPVISFDSRKTKWEKIAVELSALFSTDSDLISGNISYQNQLERKYFINTEGSEVVQNSTHANLQINASMLTEDGETIPIYKTYSAFSPDELPDYEELKTDIEEMISQLKELSEAPLAEPYTGPAILHPRAAGVFFHEIFGHRIEGHRLKSDTDGQTFKEKVNQKVLPEFIDVTSDPTLASFKGNDLNGYYIYDDQGVKGQKVEVVKDGMLKSFLMSRTPLENFEQSNGHGRAQAGMDPVSRQSNLIISSSKPQSMKELRQLLIEECKKQEKAYGYYFVDVEGGYTRTDRYSPNAFNIMPTVVYRIYADGRPDELVRGVDLIGTPLAMFAEIVATGDEKDVFNGICGAESGSVPVSAIAPSLFVRRIETQKKPVSSSKTEKPILESPTVIKNSNSNE